MGRGVSTQNFEAAQAPGLTLSHANDLAVPGLPWAPGSSADGPGGGGGAHRLDRRSPELRLGCLFVFKGTLRSPDGCQDPGRSSARLLALPWLPQTSGRA